VAALTSLYPTLADIEKAKNADGSIAPVIEMLAQMSPAVRLLYAMECNNGTKHRHVIRTGIPTPTWTAFYETVQPSKSTRTQVEDTTGMLENWTQIDERLLKIQKDKASYRMQEAVSVLEGFAQEIESTIFYGNINSAPREFHGLAPRFNSLSATNGNQIVNAGGSGSDNTSIWFVTTGPGTCGLLYPQGTSSGCERNDIGPETYQDSSGGNIRYVREQFMQHIGFYLADWRYVSRVANIDVSNLSTGSAADLFDKMIDAYYKLQNRKGAMGFSMNGSQPIAIKPIIFCNTTIKTFLHKQARNNANTMLTLREIDGEEVMSFLGMQIVETDGIVNTEATVS
jgi:hypothetical protein